MCDYQAIRIGCLQKHIHSKHEGIKYPCDQCDKQFTGKGHLKKHIQSQHKGIKYPCGLCDKELTSKDHLNTHVKSVHGRQSIIITNVTNNILVKVT